MEKLSANVIKFIFFHFSPRLKRLRALLTVIYFCICLCPYRQIFASHISVRSKYRPIIWVYLPLFPSKFVWSKILFIFITFQTFHYSHIFCIFHYFFPKYFWDRNLHLRNFPHYFLIQSSIFIFFPSSFIYYLLF